MQLNPTSLEEAFGTPPQIANVENVPQRVERQPLPEVRTALSSSDPMLKPIVTEKRSRATASDHKQFERRVRKLEQQITSVQQCECQGSGRMVGVGVALLVTGLVVFVYWRTK